MRIAEAWVTDDRGVATLAQHATSGSTASGGVGASGTLLSMGFLLLRVDSRPQEQARGIAIAAKSGKHKAMYDKINQYVETF